MLKQSRSRWSFFENDKEKIRVLAEELKVSEIVVELILNRGLSNTKEIYDFLNPSIKNIQKDFCPINLSKGIERVITAIKSKEKIIVFGDYDADGVTGTVIIYDALLQLGANASYYVPYRYTEGYGLNKQAIHNFGKGGVNLIITVDCGISNVEEIALANEYNIDVVITDHHTPPAQLPSAYAIINPKCEHKDNSVFLAGVGVAYKFIYHLYKEYRNFDLMQSKKYLELVAIGTITDVVPLFGDNRIFVRNGIEKLNRETSLGIHYLLEKMGNGRINTVTIGYGIGPRINAAGRLDSASVGIELLMTKDRHKAKEMALELNNLNERRKKEGEKIFLEATKIIEDNEELLTRKVLVLSSEEWEPGVIGIVTSQMAKHYERPAVLITTKGQISRGSIRSFSGINIFMALEKCKELLISYGGHKEAAGFEISSENIGKFKEKYSQLLDEYLEGENLYTTIKIDYELKLEDVNNELLKDINKLEPYGEGNREPIFITKNLNAIDYCLVGKEKTHLRVLFIKDEEQIEGIGYKMAHFLSVLSEYTTFDVIYNLEENNFNGQKKLQFKIVDLKPSNSGLDD